MSHSLAHLCRELLDLLLHCVACHGTHTSLPVSGMQGRLFVHILGDSRSNRKKLQCMDE